MLDPYAVSAITAGLQQLDPGASERRARALLSHLVDCGLVLVDASAYERVVIEASEYRRAFQDLGRAIASAQQGD